jgi:hypothetical protein
VIATLAIVAASYAVAVVLVLALCRAAASSDRTRIEWLASPAPGRLGSGACSPHRALAAHGQDARVRAARVHAARVRAARLRRPRRPV